MTRLLQRWPTLALAVLVAAAALALAMPLREARADGEFLPAWTAVPDADLNARRGGSTFENNAEIVALIMENQLGDNAQSGALSIAEASLSDFTGILAATFNTGHVVSIQTNIIVSIDMQ